MSCPCIHPLVCCCFATALRSPRNTLCRAPGATPIQTHMRSSTCLLLLFIRLNLIAVFIKLPGIALHPIVGCYYSSTRLLLLCIPLASTPWYLQALQRAWLCCVARLCTCPSVFVRARASACVRASAVSAAVPMHVVGLTSSACVRASASVVSVAVPMHVVGPTSSACVRASVVSAAVPRACEC